MGTTYDGSEIAIVGMACRFPGADTPEAFWRNLAEGVESLSVLSDEELAASGVRPEDFRQENFVRRASVLADIDRFDAGFFGYTGLDARLMDPQQRLFLECAWEAFEAAGYNPEAIEDPVGVFTGAKTNTYLFQLFSNQEVFKNLDRFQIALGNDLASMATRISYKFDLRGPSYAIHTACSTSLVAVHLACQSLLLDECRMALAGGASINIPQRTGYRFQKGGLLSPDGSCRTFDASAEGSNFGNGVGAVLLKRLEDATEDGDHIYALIRGSATNNDGAAKASYTAPGVDGQTAVLLEALAVAGVEARSISYVEAHGTATDLGDSIEMLALNNAYRAGTADRGFCAVGSVKTNVGHLETAAGVAGLIKTAMALEHRQLPASLHFREPNPKIDFAESPFFVNSELRDWTPAEGYPRRAGLSSFGIGSTNCHMILEEAPEPAVAPGSEGVQLLLLSARSETALDEMGDRLARHLGVEEPPPLADVAYTLQVGRKSFAYRRALVATGPKEARDLLKKGDAERVLEAFDEGAPRSVAFLFPGLGEHYPGMARGLYDGGGRFREVLDRCASLASDLGCDFLPALFPATEAVREAGRSPDLRAMLGRGASRPAGELDATRFAQPALFAVEYALAQQWQEWGIRPKALLGYSLGEYVAACVAGVLSLEDAIQLVVGRARLIEGLPAGGMIAVPVDEGRGKELGERFGLSVAGINGPHLCVLAGPIPAIEDLETELKKEETVCRRLPTTHAFHSEMMSSATEELIELARGLTLHPPEIPYISNVTGDWIKDEEATDPEYWARHLCQPVRFSQGGRLLASDRARVLLEVGPGQGLVSFLKQLPDLEPSATDVALTSLQNVFGRRPDSEYLLGSLGKLWLAGQSIDWRAFHQGDRRRRVPLPTYPFDRESHWISAGGDQDRGLSTASAQRAGQVTLAKRQDPSEWLYRPSWRPAPRGSKASEAGKDNPTGAERWLVFTTGTPEEDGLLAALRESRGEGVELVRVLPGAAFEERDPGTFTLRPGELEDYEALFRALGSPVPTRILHLFAAPVVPPVSFEGESFGELQDLGFYSLLFLARSLARTARGTAAQIDVVVSQVLRVDAEEDPRELRPAKATLLGPAKVIPQEFSHLSCRVLEVDRALLAEHPGELVEELASPLTDELVALRPGRRFLPAFDATPLPEPQETPDLLRPAGVYLITGGLGGLGLEVAAFLAQEVGARLVLTARRSLPPREDWDRWLKDHPAEDFAAKKIRRLRSLEEAGAQLLILSADATDREAMAEVVQLTRERFGSLDGVFHLAGVPGGGMMQLKSRAMAEEILAPKVMGARILVDLLQDEKTAFLLLFSSIASVLGEFGQADYCGANAFLDTLALCPRGQGGPAVMAVNWDIWQEVGLAVETEVPDHLKAWRQEMLDKAMTPAEGVSVLRRALEARLPRMVVSTQDLPGRIELGKSFTGERFLEELQKAQGSSSSPQGSKPFRRRPPRAEGGVAAQIAEIWRQLLGREVVGLDDNFFDLGGNSLMGLQLVTEMSRELEIEIEPITLFEAPTVRALARQLQSELGEAPAELSAPAGDVDPKAAIAIVSIAGRFPGANTVEAMWSNLCDGMESITFFSDEELLAAGVPAELVGDPKYVKAGALVDGVELFDAALFGYSPREAEVMDPQHRLFLEVASEAFERAGYDTSRYPGSIGVFAGSNLSTYLLRMHADEKVRRSVNMLQAILGNDKDSLTTTVSYKLDLRGPSVAVQTFCSTSLVAVHMAVRSLRQGECDMALAGGVRLVAPSVRGYLYEEGGIAPPDGHSRSFDAGANGSVLGNGVAAVLLKRLDEALRDGDQVLAVIKGSAINNDGSLKAGYTAPSIAGQAEAVAAAYQDAGVDPATVSYVEAHGSATELGDPIEIAALTKAFRRWTDEKGFCGIGSVKSNFGHLDRAAGATGLIKTVLALGHEELPPSINFSEPNPKIDFEASPFEVVTERRPWKSTEGPRRAAVNSLGMGGTNVHVVLEEAPPREPTGPSRPWQLLPVSAHTESALEANTSRLADFFKEHPEISLADAAFTLQQGRRGRRYRRMVVARDPADAVLALAGDDPRRRLSGFCEDRERRVIFLFPGLGGQYAGMAQGLYEGEASFRETIDHCAELLQGSLDLDLREILFPAAPSGDEEPSSATADPSAPVDFRAMLRRGPAEADKPPAEEGFRRTLHAQPALFVIEYALAKLWMNWGIQPDGMVGYSLGEYVAACLSGVLSLEDALKWVVRRARLIEESPGGAMVAVALAREDLEPLLGDELSISGVNGPEQTVVAGPRDAVAALEAELEAQGVSSRRLQTSHAFHSKMMEPLYESMVASASGLKLSAPQIPYLSNVTGHWLSEEDATDPTYWGRHLCQPVLFGRAIEELMKEPGTLFLEIGPGQTLSSLVLQHPAAEAGQPHVLASLRHAYENQPDLAFALGTLGKFWVLGRSLEGSAFWAEEDRRRVLLPTYAFDHRRYWIETSDSTHSSIPRAAEGVYGLTWKPVPRTLSIPSELPENLRRWWVLAEPGEPGGLGETLVSEWLLRGAGVTRLQPADAYRALSGEVFEVRPDATEDFSKVLGEGGEEPQGVIVLWGWETEAPGSPSRAAQAIHSLSLVLGEDRDTPLHFLFVTRNSFQISGGDSLDLDRVPSLAAMKRLSLDRPGWASQVVEIEPTDPAAAGAVLLEATVGRGGIVAYRGRRRWQGALEALDDPPAVPPPSKGGVVLFDGLGDRCFLLTRSLGLRRGHPLVSLEPAGFPAADEWDAWLRSDLECGHLSQRILRARELEEAGVNLLVLSVDRTVPEDLETALRKAKQHLGKVRGLVYATEPPVNEDSAAPSRERCEAGLRGLEDCVQGGVLPAAEMEWALLLASPRAPAISGLDPLAADLFLASMAERPGVDAEIPWRCVWWDPPVEESVRDSALEKVLATAWVQVVVVPQIPDAPWHPFLDLVISESSPEPEGVAFYDRPELRVEFIAPRDPEEEAVAEVWRELLGVDRVGIHDNFLELGGDSLLASRLVTRLRQIFAVELPIRLLFEASTVAELASRIREIQREEEDRELEAMLAQVKELSDEDLEKEIERREAALEVED